MRPGRRNVLAAASAAVAVSADAVAAQAKAMEPTDARPPATAQPPSRELRALLQEIDPDRIKAEFCDGVLTLFIPRAESDKPRAIKIN